jgi:hypothetical protein
MRCRFYVTEAILLAAPFSLIAIHPSFHFFIIPSTCVAEMILKLLDKCVNLSPSRASMPLQDTPIRRHTEDNTTEKSDHQPIGEHLIGHIPASLPEGS